MDTGRGSHHTGETQHLWEGEKEDCLTWADSFQLHVAGYGQVDSETSYVCSEEVQTIQHRFHLRHGVLQNTLLECDLHVLHLIIIIIIIILHSDYM